MQKITAPHELSLIFLRYMAFQKSSSLHTLRAYSLDLSQAFDLGKVKVSGLQALMGGEAISALDVFSNPATSTSPQLPQTGSLASKNRKMATLKSFLRWAFENSHLPEDYGLHLVCPKRPQKIPHFISVDEALAVLNTFEPYQETAEKVLFLLLYGGGLRVSEACNLKWSQVHIQAQQLRIMGKGGKERIVSLPPIAWAELARLRQRAQSHQDLIFAEKTMSTRKAYDVIRRAGARAGLINPLHPHALRHSFATHLLASGANLRILQAMLGHESLQATEKYTHLGIDQLARTMDNLHPLGEKQKKVS